jgi:ketosteroid isomerase-like protein
MSKLIGLLNLVFLLCGTVAVRADIVGGEPKAVLNVMRAYEDAWSRHDARAIAGFYYEPAIRVSPAGPVVRATRTLQETFFSGLLPGLIEQGFATSAWESLDVQLLDANTAVASGVVVRRRSDGSVFQRQGVTYTLWRTGEDWKIFLSATHSPSAVLRLR